jgi:CBS domain-containing protein
MLEHHIGALPIVDAAGDRLVGIFTYVDGLRALRALVAPESSAQG